MAKPMFELKFDFREVKEKFGKYEDLFEEGLEEGLKHAGVLFVLGVVRGTEKESRVPVIKTGLLRNSGFVIMRGRPFFRTYFMTDINRLLDFSRVSPQEAAQGAAHLKRIPKVPTKSKTTVTILFDVPWASKMEFGYYRLGQRSRERVAAGENIGNMFMRKHLMADRKEIGKNILNGLLSTIFDIPVGNYRGIQRSGKP